HLPLARCGEAVHGAFGPPAFAAGFHRIDQARAPHPFDRVVERTAFQVEKLVLVVFTNQALDFIRVHRADAQQAQDRKRPEIKAIGVFSAHGKHLVQYSSFQLYTESYSTSREPAGKWSTFDQHIPCCRVAGAWSREAHQSTGLELSQ